MRNLPHLVSGIPAHIESNNFKLQSRDISGNENPHPDYTGMRRWFQTCLRRFNQERTRRQAEKSPEIAPPENIEYVEFTFFGAFDAAGYENYYRENFGLSPVKFWDWNQKGLFTIVDEELFENWFIPELNRFIQDQANNRSGYGKITFIKEFEFLTTEKILGAYKDTLPIVYFSLTDNSEIYQTKIANNKQGLEAYLQEKGIPYHENSVTGVLELRNVNPQIIQEIARNFDVVNEVTACSAGIIGPSEFGTEKRRFPFTIQEPDYDIPTVGVLDTGVSGIPSVKYLMV